MPRDLDGRPISVGDAVIHERRYKLSGQVYLTYRGRVVRIEGAWLTIRLNEEPHAIRGEAARSVRRYLAIVRSTSP